MLVLTSTEKIIVIIAYAVAFIFTMIMAKVVFSKKRISPSSFRFTGSLYGRILFFNFLVHYFGGNVLGFLSLIN